MEDAIISFIYDQVEGTDFDISDPKNRDQIVQALKEAAEHFSSDDLDTQAEEG